MGTSIKERHKFYRNQDEDFVNELKEVLTACDLSEKQKYEKLLAKLGTMWPCKFGKFEESSLTKFELEIDYDKFSCLLIGHEDTLWVDILEYFYEMLNIREAPIDPIEIDDDVAIFYPI